MNDNPEVAITVKELYKTFRLPHEQNSGLKQTIVNAVNHKKGYEIQHALEDISFEVKKGEFFGIVGRNGSGKSTLLKLLAGIYMPDKGYVTVNGSLTPFIELGVGFNQELTGRENVFMNGALLGFSHKEMETMYKDIVDFAELHRFMDQKLKNYSSGMQVRLAFSIAIRAESDILILDEVLAVGDAAFQQKCFDYFDKLRKSNKTIILVTHDMMAVQRFCDRALLLKDGNIIKLGSPLDIAENYIAENVEATNRNHKKTSKPNKSLSVDILEQTNKEVDLKFSFSEFDGKGTYIGFSLHKDGITVAELNSSNNQDSVFNKKVNYRLNTENLNPGTYEISVAGFSKDKSMIATTETRAKFIVKGYDTTRGGTLKLDHSWFSPKEVED